jgi:Fe-Mn family superoxide dismutase
MGLGVGLALDNRRPERALAFQSGDAPTGPYTLPDLPYDFSALEPHIDALTMEIHHDRHHKAYVDNLNKAVADLPGLAALDPVALIQALDNVPEEKRSAVRNNAGGHVNHSMFWEIMGPEAGGEPTGAIAQAIVRNLGGVGAMIEAVNAAGLGRFGSGWSWVVLGGDGKLAVTSTPNQDNPLMDGSGVPILGIDVWEHAYYLTYQNKRADYLTAWWNVVNWPAVEERYLAAGGQ